VERPGRRPLRDRCGVTNSNVVEYAGLANRHLDHVTAQEPAPDTLVVEAQTTQRRVTLATAARTSIVSDPARPVRQVESGPDGRHVHRFDIPVSDGQPVMIDKTVAVATSRDHAISSPALRALDELTRAPTGVAGLLPPHEAEWQRLWDRFQVNLHADRDTQLVLNLHVFHLLQTISLHTAELAAGVTARRLHGEGYRGHAFWDELFVLPVPTAPAPSTAQRGGPSVLRAASATRVAAG
jgi:trehalose/maltose hydrolase-like predicted phosphorylase